MKKLHVLFAAALLALAGCGRYADTVVYGTIRTSEDDAPVVGAVAVKDGKYIYVGDREGAQAYVKEGVTEVIDHSGKGMVMPGCFEGHAHYLQAASITGFGVMIDHGSDGVAEFLEKVKAAYGSAKESGLGSISGFGWNYHTFVAQGMPTRQQIDAICPDIALFINDSEGHKGLANTLCLQRAGILDEAGNLLIPEIRGGKICMDDAGLPNGLLFEQAASYVRSRGIDFTELITEDLAANAILTAQNMLHEVGYISYMDAWSNYFNNTRFHDAARKLDAEGKLDMLLGLSYEIESSCSDVDGEIAKAAALKKYSNSHINTGYIKLFIDGTVEGGTGLTSEPYPDGHEGIANWEENEVAAITGKANAQGLTMHIHTMGDEAVHRAVSAFAESGTKQARNTIVHVRNISDEDLRTAAENDVVAVSGMLWHFLGDGSRDLIASVCPSGVAMESYPMKSFFDNGVVATSHCDFPATSGSPRDPFGIIEIAVTGSFPNSETGVYSTPWWPEELITREQAFKALTINGAWQMHCENERGSIKVGKYADFVLVDKDVFECPVTDIHNAKVLATYFEGEKVY